MPLREKKAIKSIRFDAWVLLKAIPFLGKEFANFVRTAVREKWEREGHEERWLKRKTGL